MPKSFKAAAVLHVDWEAMNTHLTRTGGEPAIGYRLGSTVMFGYSPTDESILRPNPEDNQNMRVAMGIGQRAASFVVGGYNRFHDRGDRFIPLTEGVMAGEVVSVTELDPTIPLL